MEQIRSNTINPAVALEKFQEILEAEPLPNFDDDDFDEMLSVYGASLALSDCFGYVEADGTILDTHKEFFLLQLSMPYGILLECDEHYASFFEPFIELLDTYNNVDLDLY